MTRPDYQGLLNDVEAEEAALDSVVADLSEAQWRTATPAAGWDVRDSVAHLAFTEDLAQATLADPDEFRVARDALLEAGDAALVGDGRSMTGEAVRAWWRGSAGTALTGLRLLDGRDRLLWFAGPMSAMSFATARVMETWAHGQDVRDALGHPPSVSPRLRHIADLGVRARPFAYQARGLAVPDSPLRVELAGADGDEWTWGDAAAADRVRGPALDFCLVVTQRRNPADTAVEVDGPAAAEWIGIAQAFAGPPTGHRAPSGR